VTVQTTRLSTAFTSTGVPTVELKASRKSLRAWESSNNPSNPLKPKASPRKYAETAVFGTKPPVINLSVGIITIHLHDKNYYLVGLGLLEMYNSS
jgi:hypothetical protein